MYVYGCPVALDGSPCLRYIMDSRNPAIQISKFVKHSSIRGARDVVTGHMMIVSELAGLKKFTLERRCELLCGRSRRGCKKLAAFWQPISISPSTAERISGFPQI